MLLLFNFQKGGSAGSIPNTWVPRLLAFPQNIKRYMNFWILKNLPPWATIDPLRSAFYHIKQFVNKWCLKESVLLNTLATPSKDKRSSHCLACAAIVTKKRYAIYSLNSRERNPILHEIILKENNLDLECLFNQSIVFTNIL